MCARERHMWGQGNSSDSARNVARFTIFERCTDTEPAAALGRLTERKSEKV